MVAVRQFDEEDALEKIMRAFWREGFGATSIDDLVAASGLMRGSLYGAFGNKEAMFLRAFVRYCEEVEAPLLAALDAPDLGQAVAAVFDRAIVALEDPSTPPGCLIALSLGEASGRGGEIAAALRRALAHSENAFYERFLDAQASGQLAPGRDLRALARFYMASLRSLALVHRLTGDRQTAEDIAKIALEALEGG
ncbi:MAG: helix-turn-helix domain-containing protein [Pseudomonadota bacterium]